jgi:hypothetical protein
MASTLIGPVAFTLTVVAVAVLAAMAATSSDLHRFVRQRRRDAEQTARVLQRMAAIRNRTIALMDEAERRQSRD